ncbi:MAG: YkgJ family cysteine cluster protein, partial [Limnohabitans sp.]
MRPVRPAVDVDRCDTWSPYRKGLCDQCHAWCCTMPVEVRLADLVRLGLVDPFEAEHEAPRLIARRLIKAGLVQQYHHRNERFT